MADADTRVSAEARLQRFLDLQQLLFQVSREIGPALELEPVLQTVLHAMRKLVDFKGGSIALVEGGHIRLVASDPPVSQEVLDLRLPLGSGLSGRIVESGEPIISADLRTDERVDQAVANTGSNVTMRSYIGVPLVVLGEVIGLMQVDSAEVDAFTEDDLYVLEGLGSQVAGAIESARRYEAVLELERLKSDFIERVSHELRTPITIMSGFTATLADHGPHLPEEERRAFVERLASATGRLRYLVEEILTLTSLDSGLTSPIPVEFQVHATLLEAAQATSRPGDVDIDCDEALTVRTDPAILGRVVGPLVDNAIKYAGKAHVSARRTGDGAVVIEVVDDGPGVATDLEERMFERFVRGRHTVAGMGLGLPIARHLGTSIDATIEYEARDPGTCFRVTLSDM